MNYDIVIAYRICPKFSKNPAGAFADKLSFSKFCLESFVKSLEGINYKLYVLIDNSDSEEYDLLFKSIIPANRFEISHTKLGNKGTFKKQIEILSKQNDSEIVYFAEDDYFYIKNIKNMVDFIKSEKVDFVTPYEHPGAYNKEHVIIHKNIVFKGQFYTTVQHACLTFMTTKQKLIENKNIFLIYSNWFGSDFVVWSIISLGREFSKFIKFLFKSKTYTLENFKIYGTMIMFGWWRFLINKKDLLVMPIEGNSFATHMEKDQLAPKIDWDKYL